jgi:hypothetical protein
LVRTLPDASRTARETVFSEAIRLIVLFSCASCPRTVAWISGSADAR